MSGIADMLAEFHAVLGDEPGRGGATLRVKLHDEEHRELVEELTEVGPLGFRSPRQDGDVDRAKLAHELADVVYVAFGTAHAFNIDLDAALAEIHRAAMSKVDPTCDACGGTGYTPCYRNTCDECGGTGKGERVVREDGMSEAVSA